MSNEKTITLEQLFRFYRKDLPHHAAAIAELEADLKANGYELAMVRNRPWFQTWSQAGKVDDPVVALQIIKEFEGFIPKAYPDPLSGGDPWTIGYGSTRYADGKKVQRGDVITLEAADKLLRHEVEEIASKLSGVIPHWREMTTTQRAALISFAYNLGTNFYGTTGFETISRALREKRWSDVPNALRLYRNPGSNVEAGLLRRRVAEGSLWLLGSSIKTEVQQSAPAAKFTPSSPFSHRITPNIVYGEFARYQEVRRFDHQYQCNTAVVLAQFLEKVRTHFGGKAIVVTSGYRPAIINRQVGGASGSEHLFNAPGVGAVDFYVEGADIYKVQDYCLKNWPYSVGKGAPKGFVHLGIRQGKPKLAWDY